MKALRWFKEFARTNRKTLATLVAAVALSAGVPAFVANPLVIDQIWQGVENATIGSVAASTE